MRFIRMTNELIMELMRLGLTKQQATSVTAETLTNYYMNDDGKTLIHEAERQVSEMQSLVNQLKAEYSDLKNKINDISDTILAITEAEKEHGSITDEKAKNVIALYAALLSMNEKTGADPSESVRNAGYILYAYLGGQAKREVTYTQEI